jgi:dolichyl-phosphate-mannose--protein O-mannosyl transferase
VTIQPWLIALGVVLGMAGSVKWSALYFLVAFGLFTFWADWKARRAIGHSPFPSIGQGLINALTLIFTSASVYVLSWLGWIRDADAWGRQEAPNWWLSLFSYHRQILDFHANLESDHPYQANAFSWLINLRPTAFYFEQFEGSQICGWLSSCTVAITAMPNLVIWFAGFVALLWLIKNRRRSQSAQLVILGFIAGWLPWVFFLERTAFQFYAVALVPFLILALTLALQHYWKRGFLLGVSKLRSKRIMTLVVVATLASLFYLPLWIGLPVPYELWRMQLLLPIWI